MHGAALNNMMWMRPMRGAVVEHAKALSRFRPMAQSLGHNHFPVARTPQAMATIAALAMDHVSSQY